MSAVLGFLSKCGRLIAQNKFVSAFITIHLLFAVFLGRLFALAPDEGAYLYTFNNLYGSKDPNPQFNSGWITAPKPFLWISYLPAKILNLLGVPDYLSIRILSISIATVSLVLLMNLQKRTRGASLGRLDFPIFLFFFIPSIFLWTSVGLREVFILAEMSLVFTGLSYLFENRTKRAVAYLSLGSYGLLSTKNYLWIYFALSVFALTAVWAIKRIPKKKHVGLIVGALLLPCAIFASTTSVYALKFLLLSVVHSDLSATASRSGDSIIQVAIPTLPDGSVGVSTAPTPSGSISPTNPSPSGSKAPTVVTFHGDSTLILLHFYLDDHPETVFTKIMDSLGVKHEVQKIWTSKVQGALATPVPTAKPVTPVQTAKPVTPVPTAKPVTPVPTAKPVTPVQTVKPVSDRSSMSGYILKPGKVREPLSIFRPAFLFMFGPLPFLDQGGTLLNIVAIESPIWWILYSFVLYRIIRYRRNRYMHDPVFLLAAMYFFLLVAISALVEVNLGTSFRHRSILLVPLIVMYIRTRSRPTVIAD